MSEANEGLFRRDLFKLIALGGAAASAEGCTPAAVRRPVGPEKRVVTACGLCAAGCGISVRCVGAGSKDAVQIVGIAGHPVNDGGLCPAGAAGIQHLYSPERLRGSQRRSTRGAAFEACSHADAFAAIAGKLPAGSPLVIALGRVPPAEALLVRLLAAQLKATVLDVTLPYGAPPDDALAAMLGAAELSFDLPRSDFVVSLGADWLQAHPSAVEAQRAFAALRTAPKRGLLATASPRLSITAAKSDVWLPVAPHQLGYLGLALLHGVLAKRPDAGAKLPLVAALAAEPRFQAGAAAKALDIPQPRLERTVRELLERTRPLVIADRTDPGAQAAAVALNVVLGALGREGGLVSRRLPPMPEALRAGPAERKLPLFARPPAVLLWQSNPVYSSPAAWRDALSRAPFVASFGALPDESALQADAVVALSTPLETRQLGWGATLDGAPFVSAGPAAVPMLHDTLEPIEALLRLAQTLGAPLPWKDGSAYLAAVAAALGGGADKLLAKGGTARPDAAAAAPALLAGGDAWAAQALKVSLEVKVPADRPLALSVVSPLAFADGRGAHLPYLHGLTGPGGRELWETAVELHPSTARAAQVREGHRVTVDSAAGSIVGFARFHEGVRPGTVAIALGLGRAALGRFAKGHGASPLELVADGPTFVRVAEAL